MAKVTRYQKSKQRALLRKFTRAVDSVLGPTTVEQRANLLGRKPSAYQKWWGGSIRLPDTARNLIILIVAEPARIHELT